MLAGGRGVVAHPLRCALVRAASARAPGGWCSGWSRRSASGRARESRAGRARPGGAPAAGAPGGADASHARGRRHPGLAPRGGGRMSQDLVPRLACTSARSRAARPSWLASRSATRRRGTRPRAELRERLAGELRPDGSVRGASLPTMWRVHELLDLGEPSDSRLDPCRRPMARRAPGSERRLRRGMRQATACPPRLRALSGRLLLAGASEQRLTPVTLPNGKVFRAEPAARFALSALALRAMLRAGESSRPPVRRHLEEPGPVRRAVEPAGRPRSRPMRSSPACMRWRRPGLPGATRPIGCSRWWRASGRGRRVEGCGPLSDARHAPRRGESDALSLVRRALPAARGSATLRRELRRHPPNRSER